MFNILLVGLIQIVYINVLASGDRTNQRDETRWKRRRFVNLQRSSGKWGQTAMFRRLQERSDIFGGKVDHSQNS